MRRPVRHPRQLLLAAILLLSGLAGCSSTNDRSASPSSTPIGENSALASPPNPATSVPTPDQALATTVHIRQMTQAERAAAAALLIEAEDCPVGFDDLRMLEVSYWGYDDRGHVGTLLVHADVADGVAGVFEALNAARFPIERMDAIDPIPPDPTSRVSSNVTVGFKCRAVRGGSTWSQHAFGHAVDINPVDNPSVSEGVATPPLGADRIDRNQSHPGMIHEGDVVTQAFDDIGWGWGGRWTSFQDYMHFSLTGD